MIEPAKIIVLCFSVFFFFSCKEKTEQTIVKVASDAPLFSKLDPSITGIDFKNTSIETPDRHLGFYDYFYNGSGVAIGDLNNDGLEDIFFAGNDAPNKLYVNQGDFKFKDMSKKAGVISNKWSTGVTMVDINEDGLLDIYVCNSGPYLQDVVLENQLFINNGDFTFTESAKEYGIADSAYSSQSVFFDMDGDGDLDLFVMNHSLFNYGETVQEWEQAMSNHSPEVFKKSCSTLYRNEGNGRFTDITKEAGIFRPGFGLGVAISDFNEDGNLDIYVANDYYIPDFLFFNQGDGTFVENIKSKFSHTSFYSMGCDAADINNDGLVDLMIADMTPSDHYRNKTLMESMNVELFALLTEKRGSVPQFMFNSLNLNRGKGNFSEIAHMSGVAQTDWSWAALLFDLDNDMRKDLLITNGFKRDTKDQDWGRSVKERMAKDGKDFAIYYEELLKANSVPISNYVFQNKGNLSFQNKTKDWGLEEPSFSNGAAYGDLDNDGDMDLVVNNLESLAFVYRNNTSEKGKNHFIQFELTDGITNNQVLNSRIKLYAGGEIQLVEYSFVRGYLSGMQPLAHFGLGETTSVEKAEIIWPDGRITIINNPEIDTKHRVNKSINSGRLVSKEATQGLFFDISSRAKGLTYQHKENPFNDFYTEILLPHMQSTLGPCVAVGDVNGDGLDDFYVGGAKGQAGELYVQSITEGFTLSLQNVFQQDSGYEDLGSVWIDIDSDRDLDLYVTSGGGGDVAEGSDMLQDRLYINQGDGTLRKSNGILPKITSSTSAVEPFDWDGDGDMDLFVGGRTTPGKYPLPPRSYLLENDNGQLKDVTKKLAPDLQELGMITSACWSDINQDGRKDLMVVGEWMGIKAFINKAEGFQDVSESYGLSDTTGWWYSIKSADFDKDGDDDFIVGNLGLNNKFQPRPGKPLHIYSNDFDNNGTLDIVLSKMYKGNLTPVRGKECSTEQMPFLKEKFPMYSGFASSTLEDIYGVENLENALHYEVNSFASIYMENQGNGNFTIKELPIEAQISPIMDMVIWDFNKDGNLDVVIGGNMYNTEVETPAYDAGKGLYLHGLGDGTFLTMPQVADSGIFMPLNTKDLAFIKIGGDQRPGIITANNNSKLQLFAWTR